MKNYDRMIYGLVAACALLLLHAPLFEWWCGTGIGKFLYGIKPSCFIDTVSLLLIILGCSAVEKIPSLLSNAGNKWCRALAASLLIVLAVESIAFDEQFLHFSSLPCFRYSDILFPILISFIIVSWIETRKEEEHDEVLREVSSTMYYDCTDEADFLGRGDLVFHICKRLKENNGNQNGSTGVAICGGWGTGKSWVLEHIKETLKDGGDICIDFKPWLYGEADMTRLFYQVLGSQLQSNGAHIEELNRAVTEIDNDELSGFGRAILSLLGIVTKRDSRERTINEIKKKLTAINRPIYLFIDDIDRLAKKELLQVLSLIRNTGDFPNLTYILAFDKVIVSDILDHEKGLGYVSKMINLSLELPTINDAVISSYLYEALKTIKVFPEELDNPFARIPITNYLPTVREAKRYLNLLLSDYKRREDVFERYYCHLADYCLIELLKYSSPEVYYKLKSVPSTYLKLVKDGWNSPVWVPREDLLDDKEELLTLLKQMFKVVSYSQEQYEMIGIANNEYFPLYFEGNNDLRYIDGEEIVNALENGTFPKRIGKWILDGHTGVMGILCFAQSYLTRKELFLAMAEYIWHQCEKGQSVNSLDRLTVGYDKEHYRHSYKQIQKLIAETPQIHLLTFQHLDREEDEKGEGDVSNGIGLPLELMGIWMNELRYTGELNYPYYEVKGHIKNLWKKLTEELIDRDIYTLNMIDICGDCTEENTFEEMVLPMVCDNPQRWLGASIAKVQDKDKSYYLVKSDVVHALFGELGLVNDELKAIAAHVREEDKKYVKEYEELFNRIAAMTVYKDDPNISQKYRIPDCIEIEEFTSLAESIFIGISPIIPINMALAQLMNTEFWKGNNIRIRRKKVDYFFCPKS